VAIDSVRGPFSWPRSTTSPSGCEVLDSVIGRPNPSILTLGVVAYWEFDVTGSVRN
jgi:hypothetical protein